jgi:hypothetical protein
VALDDFLVTAKQLGDFVLAQVSWESSIHRFLCCHLTGDRYNYRSVLACFSNRHSPIPWIRLLRAFAGHQPEEWIPGRGVRVDACNGCRLLRLEDEITFNIRRWKSPQRSAGCLLTGRLKYVWRALRNRKIVSPGDPNSGTDKPDGKHRRLK